MLQKAEVDSACTIVVIAGPTHDYIPPVLDAVKKFVDGGGKALVMFTPASPIRAVRMKANRRLKRWSRTGA